MVSTSSLRVCHFVFCGLLLSVCISVSPMVLAEVASAPKEVANAEGQQEVDSEILSAASTQGVAAELANELLAKPLYQFSESELGTYLGLLQTAEPDLSRRIIHLARKNLGQPYELYLLGEAPYETHDPQPLYCLGKSDCLVFAEHCYAMALSSDWPSFMTMLQRVRYRDGVLGVRTRNHYTEVDWNSSNRWLVSDLTDQLAGDAAVEFRQKINRQRFFKKRYELDVDVPVEEHIDHYVPLEKALEIRAQLKPGDFVNIVRGVVSPDAKPNSVFGGSAWVGHVGLITKGPDGETHVIHSAQPVVREEPLADYIAKEKKKFAEKDAAGKARLLGFKFLRLNENPLEQLAAIDGEQAPKVTLPDGTAFDPARATE